MLKTGRIRILSIRTEKRFRVYRRAERASHIVKILRTVSEMQDLARFYKSEGLRIGFVPTMGYLHEAHAVLMRMMKERSDVVVVSIFVNPTQFGENEDFDTYPRDFERDEALCEKEGVAAVFYPSAEEMYPEGFSVYVDETSANKILEGSSRPGHFRGVTTVVAKLFNAVLPDVTILGEKDAQQFFILNKMVKDLNFPVEMVMGPIVRHPDGLAMSSRNTYLDETQRADAVCMPRTLEAVREAYEAGERDVTKLKEVGSALIETYGSPVLDYIEVVDEATFQPIEEISAPARVLLAARFGTTRLLDNMLLS